MSKKDEKKIEENLEENIDSENPDVAENETELTVEQLSKKLSEQEEITKRAQSDYFRMKLEFDEYVKRRRYTRTCMGRRGTITIYQNAC